MSINEILAKGGPVMWILGAYSVIAMAIVIERGIHFLLMGRAPRELDEDIGNGRLKDRLAELRGPEAAVAAAMMEAMRQGVHDLGRVASRVGSKELRRMERGLRTLAFLGDTAPLLGLFGTITGMIKAFMVIEQAGGKVDAQALAGGIWEAMVTTGAGLAVSIPVLFLSHLLEGMADKRAHSMKRVASMLIERHAAGDAMRRREGVMDGA
ncbi:MAG: MotA/TolQ/ExbB proton channel family protein [Candidatus Nitrospinota bacterium M3_3B_026]